MPLRQSRSQFGALDFRLLPIQLSLAVRSVDFRAWGVCSGIFWAASCTLGITGALNNKSSLNIIYALLISTSGLVASICGILSITGLWLLLRVRHRFFSPLSRRLDYQIKYNLLLGIHVSTNLITLDIKTIYDNYGDIIKNFEFANSESELLEFSILNSLAYSGNNFGTSPRKKFQRNFSLSEKNRYCNLLLRRNLRENFWGISSIFPMHETMWDEYIASGKSDNEFSPDLIVSSQSGASDHFSSLLIFSIGAVSSRRYLKHKAPLGDLNIPAGLMVLIGIFFQISELVRSIISDANPTPILNLHVAANDPVVIRVFQSFGFKEIGKSTGDDIPILSTRISVKF